MSTESTDGSAAGQGTAPTENKGVKVGAPTSLDLGQEVEGIDGRQLRMRVVTVEPVGRPITRVPLTVGHSQPGTR